MTDLIDLDCYKEAKGIKSTLKDGQHQTLITQVSALVETYCNRKFIEHSTVQTAITEWKDGKTNLIYLDKFPVLSVVSVKTSQDGGTNQTTLTEGDSAKGGYYADLENGTVMTQVALEKFVDTYDVSYRSLEIVYTYGYITGNLPKELELAMVDLVHYYDSGENIPSKSLLGATVDNAQPYLANSFPPHIRRILDLYRYSP